MRNENNGVKDKLCLREIANFRAILQLIYRIKNFFIRFFNKLAVLGHDLKCRFNLHAIRETKHI